MSDWLIKHGMPPRYANATIHELPTPPNVQKLHEAAASHIQCFISGNQRPSRGLFIGGAVGTGKSHCMFAIARVCLLLARAKYDAQIAAIPGPDHPDYDPGFVPQFRKPRQIVAVITFREFLYRLTQPDAVGNKFNIPAAVDKLCSAKFLFIDDMTVRVNAIGNAESPYRWAYDAVNELVDRIWSEMNQTTLYVTTNNKPAELANAFGDWCVDRITGICDPIWIEGESFRS